MTDHRLRPQRSQLFRLVTISSVGAGAAALIGMTLSVFFDGAVMSDGGGRVVLVLTTSLGGVLAAFSCLSFFAGVDESEEFITAETRIDRLTGLLTNLTMIGALSKVLARTLQTGKPAYLINIDIDRFKQINDQIGFSGGDELIVAVAKRLRSFFGEDAKISRFSGGEFAVLIENDIDTIEPMLDQLVQELMAPYRLSTHNQSISVCAGVVALPMDGRDPLVVTRRASLALQRARARGFGGWAVFEPEMSRVADYRQWIEKELTTALERGDFALHYQPQFGLHDNRIIGYEALIRWNHPERGLIPPGEFISVAEESGMIVAIGRWTLRQACFDARDLPKDVRIAINLSPVQFMERNLTRLIRQTCIDAEISPSQIEFEITETAMTMDRDRARAIMTELREMGFGIAIDDFGTGYSNLGYLIDFPFDKLKIDRAFVSRLESDKSAGAVISTIVGLSRALGARTLAEGVENPNQAVLLRAAGCDSVQGFYYARPAPLETLLRDHAAKTDEATIAAMESGLVQARQAAALH